MGVDQEGVRRRVVEASGEGKVKSGHTNGAAGDGAADAGWTSGASPREEERRDEEHQSMLKARTLKDFLARVAFVGIFITENVMHAVFFELEVDSMVAPALAPLPREAAVCLHLVHVIFGLFGAAFVLISGLDTAGRTALTKGTSMMLVFMSTITWTWWINRQGVLYWDVDPYPFWDVRCSPEKRNRTVHILKNISIVGALTMYQQIAKYERAALKQRPSFFEGLVSALRPWTFTATIAPQLVALAVIRCFLRVPLPGYYASFLLLLSIMAIQAVANLVNSLKDFERGIDTHENAGDRTLVDALVTPRLLKLLAGVGIVWWFTYFFWSVAATNFHPMVLSLAALGTFLALGYTAGPAPLKYLGLGDLAVFVSFGPALMAYSSVVLVGELHLEVLSFTLPVTLYVVATLHANNYRDIDSDRRAGIRTVATMLGPGLSLRYYYLLLGGAHVAALVTGYRYGCAGAIASVAVLPQTLWLCRRIHNKSTLRTQDEETAKSTMMFGVALGLGIIINPTDQSTRLGFLVPALVVSVLKVFAN